MKYLSKRLYWHATLLLILLLVGCSGSTNEGFHEDDSHNNSHSQSEQKSDISDEDTELDKKGADSKPITETKENPSEGEEYQYLSKYSANEIEYARVWLQLGANQEIDELNVRHIPTGTPLNPDDDTSAGYPEDVIQLAGSRLVDGSITYSGNGDGTINVYNVPLRWDGKYPAGEQFYSDLINHTKLVYIETGNDEEIIKLINKMKRE